MVEKKKDDSTVVSLVIGILFVLVGAFLLFGQRIMHLSIENLWPLFFLIPISLLSVAWIQDREKNEGAVIPVVILTFLMVYFLWLNFTHWGNVEYTWPNFLLAPGLGLLVFYFTGKKKEVLIPAFILLSLGAIFYSMIYQNSTLIALLMIGTGMILAGRSLFLKSPEKKE
jgi:hypothetical protein